MKTGKAVGIMQIDTRDGRGRFEQDDLDLLAAVASQISVAVQNAQLHKALIKQREMEQELQFARQVMQSLLPDRPASVPGYEFWAYYEPARHVGGDYYGFIPIPCRRVEETRHRRPLGHRRRRRRRQGDAGCLLDRQALGRGADESSRQPRPGRVVAQLNRPFEAAACSTCTSRSSCVVLDVQNAPPDRRQRRPSLPAHPPPRRPPRRIRPMRLRAAAGNHARLRLRIRRNDLEPGETVVLYTDGVTDAMDASGDRLGEDLFQESLLKAGRGATAAGEEVVQGRFSTTSPTDRSSTTSRWFCLARK